MAAERDAYVSRARACARRPFLCVAPCRVHGGAPSWRAVRASLDRPRRRPVERPQAGRHGQRAPIGCDRTVERIGSTAFAASSGRNCGAGPTVRAALRRRSPRCSKVTATALWCAPTTTRNSRLTADARPRAWGWCSMIGEILPASIGYWRSNRTRRVFRRSGARVYIFPRQRPAVTHAWRRRQPPRWRMSKGRHFGIGKLRAGGRWACLCLPPLRFRLAFGCFSAMTQHSWTERYCEMVAHATDQICEFLATEDGVLALWRPQIVCRDCGSRPGSVLRWCRSMSPRSSCRLPR